MLNKKPKINHNKPNRARLETLEPRLLFSADLPYFVPDSAQEYAETQDALGPSTLFIIDAGVPDVDKFIADIKQQYGSSADIWLLDSSLDGLSQISAILASSENVSAVHLISHGSDAQLELGNATVGIQELMSRAAEVSLWRDRFTQDADFLIYGCDLAASKSGQHFIDTLSLLTSTDVAASVDKTGNAKKGGDWDLEYRTGEIDKSVAVSQSFQEDYVGTLFKVNVTSLVDTLDSGIVENNAAYDLNWLLANPGADGLISLREALIAANNTNSGDIEIVLNAGIYHLTLTETGSSTGGDISINRDITITGAGNANTVIDANGNSRFFDVQSGSLTLNYLQLTNGNSSSSGGAVVVGINSSFYANHVHLLSNSASISGGAVHAEGLIEIKHSTISNSNALNNFGGAFYVIGSALFDNVVLDSNNAESGGAIFSTASADLTILNGAIENNIAVSSGGGIVSVGDLSITGTHIANNIASSGNGGGIYAFGSGLVSISDASVFTNSAQQEGGGVFLNLMTDTVVQNTSIDSNQAGLHGGGFFVSGSGDVLVDSSTISSNVASNGNGGGIDNSNHNTLIVNSTLSGNYAGFNGGGISTSSSIELIHATITENTARSAGGLALTSNGNLTNTLVANNQINGGASTSVDIDGVVLSGGGNLVGDGTGSSGYIGSDIVGVSPIVIHPSLGPLTLNGGPTATHSAPIFSQAIDNGVSVPTVTTDQRGQSRAGSPDIGAYEFVVSAVNNTNPSFTSDPNVTVVEQTQTVIPIQVQNSDNDKLVYSLVGSVDDGLFNIDSATGNITFSALPDYLAPADHDSNNVYEVVVRVDDLRGGVDLLVMNITVVQEVVSVVVTTTDDTVDGDTSSVDALIANQGVDSSISLREAILAANNVASEVAITFDISQPTVGGVHTLMIDSPLPSINNKVTIDASTEPDYVNAPVVVLDGTNAGIGTHGLLFSAGSDGSKVNGLGVVNFDGSGILLYQTDNHEITNNYLGTDGSLALGNGRTGLDVSDSANNVITNNVSSGNAYSGIRLIGSGSTNNVLYGNYVGTDSNGSLAIANGTDGMVVLNGASGNTIGGVLAGQENLLSGNTQDGLEIEGSGTNNNLVQNNFIGTDVTGTAAIANGRFGILIYTGPQNNLIGGAGAEGNVISGNGSAGIMVSGGGGPGTANNTIQGNNIGLDITGSAALSNGYHGVIVELGASGTVIGGSSADTRNVISANNGSGVVIRDTNTINNILTGNFIGTDRTGTVGMGNTGVGIEINQGAADNTIGGSVSTGNVISGNGFHGIHISGAGTNNIDVAGNLIGTNQDGTQAISNGANGVMIGNLAQDIVIGGDTAVERNIVSGNTLSGVSVESASSVLVQGNYIGTDITGSTTIANSVFGVDIYGGSQFVTVGGSLAGTGNVISGNTQTGVYVRGGASNISIGGTAVGSGNVITNNGGAGINVADGSVDNALLGNQVYSNTGLAIDLNGDGVTTNDPNDVDTGANNLQNSPVLTSASIDNSGRMYVAGTLASAPNTTYRIEFFYSTAATGAGPGEAQSYWRSMELTTGSTGATNFSISAVTSNASGGYISATATEIITLQPDPDLSEFGSTSEVSEGQLVEVNNRPTTIGIPDVVLNEDDPDQVISLSNYFDDLEDGPLGLTYSVIANSNSALFSNLSVGAADQLDISLTPNASGNSDITILAVDSGGFNISAVFNITVNAVNDEPIVVAPSSVFIDENTVAVTTVSSTDVDGGTPVYGLASGLGDNDYFAIDANTGELRFLTAPDAENPLDANADNTYLAVVQVNDGQSLVEHNIAVTVNDINDNPPSVNPAQSFSIAENSQPGTIVGVVTAIDSDRTSVLQNWAIVSGNAEGHFEINSTSGEITLGNTANVDFENQSSYDLGIQVGDGLATSVIETVRINVSDVNEAPTVGTINPIIVNEDSGPVVVDLTNHFNDAEDGSLGLNYSIVSSSGSIFSTILISPAGELTAVLLPDAVGSGDILIQAEDSQGEFVVGTVSVNVLPVNDAPVLTLPTSTSIDENTAFVTTAMANDVDGDALSFSLDNNVGDNSFFTINASSGELSFAIAPDAENALDGDGNNTYIAQVQVSDGLTTSLQTISITVQDVNDSPPVIDSNQQFTISEETENGAAIGAIAASDADTVGGLQNWSIVGGNANGAFTIDSNTGELIVANAGALVFETTPQYNLIVQVSDGDFTSASESILINLTNVNDDPQIISTSTFVITEGDLQVGTVTVLDVDGPTTLYSIVGSKDDSLFSINGNSGVLVFNQAPDFEAPSDTNADNSYELTVQVADGAGGVTTQEILVIVQPLNEHSATAIVDADVNPNSVVENAAVGTAVGFTAFSEDLDAGDSVTYSLLDKSSDLFVIDAVSGVITSVGVLDYETQTEHSIIVQATSSDGSSVSRQVTVSVLDINDNPTVITPNQTYFVPELGSNQIVLEAVESTDLDTITGQLIWSIVSGNDNGTFGINASSGELFIANASGIDFENQQEYALMLSVDDGELASLQQQVSVNVVDVNEAPVIQASDMVVVAGYEGVIGSITVNDPDFDRNTTLEIIGGSAETEFAIDQDSFELLQLRPMASGDYSVIVKATDEHGASTEAVLRIQILPANDAVDNTAFVDNTGVPSNQQTGVNNSMLVNKEQTDSTTAQKTDTSDSTTLSLSEQSEAGLKEVEARSIAPDTQTDHFSVAQSSDGIGSVVKHNDKTRDSSESAALSEKQTNYELVLELLFEEAGSFVRTAAIGLEDLNVSTVLSPSMLGALEALHSEIADAEEHKKEQLKLVVQVGSVATLSFTVGFISWLLQTGALLTTAVSTAPLWRSFDPIPVLVDDDHDNVESRGTMP